MELCDTPAYSLAQMLAKGDISAVEVVASVFARIARKEDALHCYLHLNHEGAVAAAQAADAQRLAGQPVGPLAGVPVAVKDNMCIAGMPTTCASKVLAGYVPPYDATVIKQLKQAGLAIVGKANMDEFAMGSSTENSGYGPTHNPWSEDRVPGGSSGGSAAAVAAGETVVALGSDTGGSIRQPAAFCGVVGLKPTYGRVSRFGLVAYASSLDQIGPITRSVRDCALMMNVIAGHDPLDSTSIPEAAPDFTANLDAGVKGLVVGLPREYFAAGIAPEVRDSVYAAVKLLESLGAKVEEVSMPRTDYALAAYYVVAPSECSSNLARYDGVRYGHRSEIASDTVTLFSHTREEGFGPEVKRRIMLGTYALSAGYYDAYYLKALKVRTLVKQDFDQAFAKCDVLATPTAPTVAFRLGEKTNDPMQMYLSDVCTIPANLAGLPAISVPCGFSAGLPIGLQLIGPALQEHRLLQTAYAYEQAANLAPLTPQMEVR